MGEEEKYLYCFIGCTGAREFPVTENGRVYTLNYMDLAAVVGDFVPPDAKAHRLVVEEVFKDFTVLPVRFDGIARTTDDIKEILKARYFHLQGLLWEMENKVEIGLKAWWKGNPLSTDFMDRYYPKFRDWRRRLADAEPPGGKRRTEWIEAKVKLKERAMNAVGDVRRREREKVLTALDSLAVDKRIKAAIGIKMLLNLAFLVEKSRQIEFVDAINGLVEKYGTEIELIHTGPLPPYSFVNLVLS